MGRGHTPSPGGRCPAVKSAGRMRVIYFIPHPFNSPLRTQRGEGRLAMSLITAQGWPLVIRIQRVPTRRDSIRSSRTQHNVLRQSLLPDKHVVQDAGDAFGIADFTGFYIVCNFFQRNRHHFYAIGILGV